MTILSNPPTMLRSSLSLGRLGDTELRVHSSWSLAAPLIAYVCMRLWFPTQLPGLDAQTYLAMGFCAALLVLLSVVLHELAHVVVASARKQRPRVIVLLVYGGVWDVGEAVSPTDELLIWLVGPLFSLAAAFGLSVTGRTLVPSGTPVGELLAFGVQVNLVLAVLHALPAPPFDGSRIVRALAVRLTGSPSQASRISTVVGQFTAIGLIAVGASQVLSGSIFTGVCLALSGWFIAVAMVRSGQLYRASGDLSTLRVADLMDTRPAFATADMSVAEFVKEHALRGGRLELLVLEDDNQLAGMVNVAAVSNLAEDRWASTPIARVMHRPPLPTLSPDQAVEDVLAILRSAPFAQLPVVREGWVVGMFGNNDLARFQWLRGRLRFEVGETPAERRRVGLGWPKA